MALAPNDEVDICNMALIVLKQKPSVTSIVKPNTDVEQLCAQWYHAKRRSLLRSHPWNFAIRRTIITKDLLNPPLFGFTDAFTLPGEFIRYMSRHDVSGVRVSKSMEEYQMENGQLLLTTDGTNEARIRMIYDHVVVSKWDPLFTELLAIELAIKIAPHFTGGKGWVASLKEDRKDLTQQARAIDGQERPPVRTERSKWLASRARAGTGRAAGPIKRFP